MKTIILLAFLTAAFSSCTTAYKTGQTPDDVYYSPAKPQDESAKEEKEEDRYYSYDDNYYDDRFLRMKVRNRYRWSDLDSWYGYDRYSIGYNYSYGSFNNPFNTWSYYYNPYCCCLNNYNYVYVNPKAPVSQPVVRRHFSLTGYTNTGYNNSNNSNNAVIKSPGRATTTTPAYNNSNNGLSNKVKTIFSNDNSGSGSSRTYNPSSSSSSGNNNSSSSSGSSGNSGGSSGGAVKRPSRN